MHSHHFFFLLLTLDKLYYTALGFPDYPCWYIVTFRSLILNAGYYSIIWVYTMVYFSIYYWQIFRMYLFFNGLMNILVNILYTCKRFSRILTLEKNVGPCVMYTSSVPACWYSVSKGDEQFAFLPEGSENIHYAISLVYILYDQTLRFC